MADGRARLRRARRLDRRPARLVRVPPRRCRSEDRRADPGHPASAGDRSCPISPASSPSASGRKARVAERRRARSSDDHHPRRAGRRPSLRRAQRQATSGSGSTASARRAAACPRPIRCWPRSPSVYGRGRRRRDAERHGPRRPDRQPAGWSSSGGAMLAQDRHSAAVWGMPRVVAEAGLASAVLPPAELARASIARSAPHGSKRLLPPHPGEPARGAHRPAAGDEPALADRHRSGRDHARARLRQRRPARRPPRVGRATPACRSR